MLKATVGIKKATAHLVQISGLFVYYTNSLKSLFLSKFLIKEPNQLIPGQK
jgi:hypothetical protein